MSWLIPWPPAMGPCQWRWISAKDEQSCYSQRAGEECIPGRSYPRTIIDGMSLVQKMKGNDQTFAQLAESAIAKVLHEGAKSQCMMLSLMFTRAIKDAERTNRGADSGIQFRNIAPGHNIQQWRKLLCSSANKASLIKFLVDEWNGPKYREKLENKTLYTTCEEVCFKVGKDQWEEVIELRSCQEEADTRMLLHSLHAAESGYKAVIITAEDTDVLVLCLGFSKHIPCPMYQKCGTKNITRYLDTTKVPSYSIHWEVVFVMLWLACIPSPAAIQSVP